MTIGKLITQQLKHSVGLLFLGNTLRSVSKTDLFTSSLVQEYFVSIENRSVEFCVIWFGFVKILICLKLVGHGCQEILW